MLYSNHKHILQIPDRMQQQKAIGKFVHRKENVMKKKVLALFMAVSLASTSLPMTALATETGNVSRQEEMGIAENSETTEESKLTAKKSQPKNRSQQRLKRKQRPQKQ